MTGRLEMTGDALGYGNREFGKSFIPGHGYTPATQIPKPLLRSLAHGQRQLMARGVRAQERAHSAQQHVAENAVRETSRSIKRPNISDGLSGSRQPDVPIGRGRTARHFQFNSIFGSGKLPPGVKAIAVAGGGRRGATSSILSNHDATPHVLNHEAAHLTPKRTAYRARNFNSGQRAREEARADMASGNPHDYHRKTSFKASANGGSGYAISAKNPIARRLVRQRSAQGPGSIGGSVDAGIFDRKSMKGYRDVQDRIAAARSRQSSGHKPFGKADKDRSAQAVGVGTTAAALGLIGGGFPGARPESGRLANVQRGTKYQATRHLVSAARGGIFGYREDAHRAFLNRQNADLRGWRADSVGNSYHRATVQGKAQAEKPIIRTMQRARTGSNVVLAGGAVLAGGGLVAHQRRLSAARHRQRPGKRRVAKADEWKSDATIAAGTAVGVGGVGGSLVLDHQGRKWAKRSAANLQASRMINTGVGGHDINYSRKKRFLPRTGSRVPDIKPHRNFDDLLHNSEGLWQHHSPKDVIAAGKLRGEAAQQRYFARVYGFNGRVARKVGVAGAAVAAAGAGTKYLQVKPEYRRPVRKVDTTMSDEDAHRLATRYDTRGPLPKTLSREQKMKAYEARYIASGGKQGEKWKHRADRAEQGRNAGLVGATASTAALLATRGRRTGPKLARLKITPHRAETAALASAVTGGAAELYGEHARARRASYANSPAGVAGSALTRMQAYTPGRTS